MSNSQAAQTIKVLIVEDHELTRYGLSMALGEKEDITVVGEAENGRHGVDMALSEKPDIVLMDIAMPVMDGIAATQELKTKMPDVKVVMLTSNHKHEEVLASLSSGADAYCMKEIKIERLYQVLQMVMDGAIWLDPTIARMVMQTLPAGAGPTTVESLQPAGLTEKPVSAAKARYNTDLTEREREVLKLIVAGKSNKEIASLLNFSTHTAKAHVGNIIQKLAVDDRTQVAVKALRDGLV